MAEMVVVTCDACETKNRIDKDKYETARCGRCRNPLLDAAMQQLGLGESEDEDEDEGDEEEEDGAGRVLDGRNKSRKPADAKIVNVEDMLRDLFGK